MTPTRDEMRVEARNLKARLRAYQLWADAHPGLSNKFVRQPVEEQLRHLESELALTTDKDTNTMTVNIPIMRDYLAKVQGEMRTLHLTASTRKFTTEEQTRWDELNTDAAEVETNIQNAVEAEKRAADLAERRAHWGNLGVSTYDAGPVTAGEALRMDGRTARDTALRMVETSAKHLTDDQKSHLDTMLRSESTPNLDMEALHRHVAATNTEDYRSAFRKLCGPNPGNVYVLSGREAEAIATVNRSSLAEGAGTGGYLVPAFLDPTIALNAQGSANPIRRLARNETINTNKWKGIGTSGVTWAFVPEGDPSTEDSPTLSQPDVDLFTARAWLTYSFEIQQDAIELEKQLFRLIGNGWDETMAGVLATGSGSGAPTGVITALDAIAGSEVQITAAGSLAHADISKAWVSLPDRARANASWVMNESVRESIASWGDEYGNRSVDLGGQLQKLRERPVYSTDKFPAIATTTGSANQLVVGDFTGYLIVQRAGMTVEPVPIVVDGNGNPVGKRGLLAWARIGADVIDPGLLRLLQQ